MRRPQPSNNRVTFTGPLVLFVFSDTTTTVELNWASELLFPSLQSF